MIDQRKEKIYCFSEFLRVLKVERNLDRTYSAVRRWAREGWHPRGNPELVVKLESIPICGIDFTSLEAFDRFLDAQSKALDAVEMHP